MEGQRFNPKEFAGVVQLKHYAMMPDGKQYIGIAGSCSVISDEEMVGFEVKGGDTANWVMRIDGPTSSVNVLGCQIRMAHQFDEGLPETIAHEYFRVP